MELGMIGLGKMGANMTSRLIRGGHRLVVSDRNADAVRAAAAGGAEPTTDVNDLVGKLTAPRAVWVMVPSGEPTESTIAQLVGVLQEGDIIIDGGNSNYKDSMRRAVMVSGHNMHLVDVGTSGGIWGLAEGYSLMVGGDKAVVDHLNPIFETLAPAPDRGWGHVGPNGAGHFVKMVHNGIEYGLMQAYAEGFELMRLKTELQLDTAQIAEIWRYGSVVRSWLLDLAARALQENPNLEGIAAYVPDSGEGRWTVAEAIDLGCSLPVITLALETRFRSRSKEPFSDRLLAALRNQFGGHAVVRSGSEG
ncbi:MAG: decarboxylating 6-phosphogluconate dehydrogenase [Chloroflexota bacterium]